MPDVNRLQGLVALYNFGTFADPNGPRPDMREAVRVEICQIASELTGVWVSERDSAPTQE